MDKIAQSRSQDKYLRNATIETKMIQRALVGTSLRDLTWYNRRQNKTKMIADIKSRRKILHTKETLEVKSYNTTMSCWRRSKAVSIEHRIITEDYLILFNDPKNVATIILNNFGKKR